MKEDDIQNTIDYTTKGEFDAVIFIEDICRELNVEYEKFWIREADEDDWVTTNGFVISQSKPLLAENFELVYSLLIKKDNEKLVRFADNIIFSLKENWGYLEGCLRKEEQK